MRSFQDITLILKGSNRGNPAFYTFNKLHCEIVLTL